MSYYVNTFLIQSEYIHTVHWMIEDYYSMDDITLKFNFKNFCKFYKLPFQEDEDGELLLREFIEAIHYKVTPLTEDANSRTPTPEPDF